MKLQKYIGATILTGSILLGVGAVKASPLVFKQDNNSQEYKIVSDLYSAYLKKHPGIVIETALGDLQGQGKASIFIKMKSQQTCKTNNPDSCYMTALVFKNNTWQALLNHTAETVELGRPSPAPGGEGMKDIILDGHEAWRWSGLGKYFPMLESIGKVYEAKNPAPAEMISYASQILSKDIQEPSNITPAQKVHWNYSDIDITKIAKTYWVMAESGIVCGSYLGCPATLMIKSTNGGYRSILETYAQGKIAVLPSVGKDDFHDIALGTGEGYSVLRYDGAKYKLISTSFPSSVTPIP